MLYAPGFLGLLEAEGRARWAPQAFHFLATNNTEGAPILRGFVSREGWVAD
jgi:hypothetical protein